MESWPLFLQGVKQMQYLFRFREKKFVCRLMRFFFLRSNKLFGSFFLISLRIESFLGIGTILSLAGNVCFAVKAV